MDNKEKFASFEQLLGQNMDRRDFLRRTSSIAALAAGLSIISSLNISHVEASPKFLSYPFTLGVASGDPLPDGIVLWTRLAPDPLNGGGMPAHNFPVHWEVATDEGFRHIVRRGTEVATPKYGHSVHAEVDGLQPDRWYYYRFTSGSEVSPVGKTKTAPALASSPERLRFAVASCQNWQDGYFTAHRHLSEEDVAFVIFLGDYIYESAPRSGALRIHEGKGEPYSLEEYRNRHAQYKSDSNLQAAHAACPWIVTLDDHEIDNNWADEIPQDPHLQSPEAFLARRIAALQAYYEHMPIRRLTLPTGPDMKLYRRFTFGDLAEMSVLDTRQYRTDQPNTKEGAYDPSTTMTGHEQEQWFLSGLAASKSRWNIIAQQVMMAQNDRKAGPEESFDFDNWDGYRVQRRRIFEFLHERKITNPVVLTGDRHCTWVSDLKIDFDEPSTPTVAAEFTVTSISSGGNANPDSFQKTYSPIMAESPHWKFIDNRRGYYVCDVNRERMLTDLRVVSDVLRPERSTVSTLKQFVVEHGKPGVGVV